MSIQKDFMKKYGVCSVVSDSDSERESDGTRRKLYTEENDAIEVLLRIRGYTTEETRQQIPVINFRIENGDTLVVNPPEVGPSRSHSHKFNFSGIYDSSVGQQQLYESALHDIIKEFVGGANFLVFNYGVTNAGKTYTMQGTPQQPGLVPRALDAIFALLRGKISPKITVKPHNGGVIKLGPTDVSAELRFKEDVMNKDCDSLAASIFMDSLNLSSASSVAYDAFSTKTSSFSSFNFTRDSLNTDGETTFSIWVSFLEVYNEVVFDLLETIEGPKRNSLKLCEHRNGNVFIKGAKEVCVFTAEEAYRVLLAGQKNLSYAATKLNHNSSRSHCLFAIKLLTIREAGTATVTQLSFCDLAGSERAAKTQSKGDRLKEAGLINTSLLVLGRCFQILRTNQKLGKSNRSQIPFRDSKLTRILQNTFNGKTRALMMVNISPCSNMYSETMHVLKFSAIASEVLLSQNSDDLLRDFQRTRTSLAPLSRSPGDRGSLPWESSNVEGESRDRDANRTTAVTEGDEEWETDEEDVIDYKKKTYELLELAQKFADKLIKERADKLQMEIDIREELTENFQAHVNQLHDFYQDQLEDVYDEAEEMAEKRIEIHDHFYRNTKRVRHCSSGDPRESCGAEEARSESDSRIAELESNVRVLQKETESLREDVRRAVQSEVRKQEQLTALHFEMAEVKREAGCHVYDKQIEALKREIASTKAELESQTKMVVQAETDKKCSTELVESLARNVEKTCQTMLLLSKAYVKPNIDVLPVADDVEARRHELTRRSVYYSMSSSSGPSTTETPKSTEVSSSSDDEIRKLVSVSLTLSESPEMPELLPEHTAADNPNEVFEEEDNDDTVDSVPETPEAKVTRAAALFVDSATSPVFAVAEKADRETLSRRIAELEEEVREAKILLERKEMRTPSLQKVDVENRFSKTGKTGTSKKVKATPTAREPLPQDGSSSDEMTSASLSKKKSKVPLPKKQPEKDRCTPVQEPLAEDSPDIQTRVLRKLRRRK